MIKRCNLFCCSNLVMVEAAGVEVLTGALINDLGQNRAEGTRPNRSKRPLQVQNRYSPSVLRPRRHLGSRDERRRQINCAARRTAALRRQKITDIILDNLDR